MSSIFDASKPARQARDELRSVRIPDEAQLRVQLQRAIQVGELTPAQAATILQEQTAYQQIQEDPRLRGEQIDVLSDLDNQIAEGGLDARARAGIGNVQSEIGTQARGAREAIEARARALGLQNSDLALTQQMISDQSAATRGAEAGLNIAALAEERRAQAQREKASLAANLRNADYQKASSQAAAQDAINRFNTANRQDVENRNVQARNIAQAQNLSERQRAADTNVGLANRQEETNKRIPLDLYGARMGKAQGIATTYGAQGAAEAARDEKLLQAASSAAMAFSDERLKKDVQPIDSSSVLEDLSGVKFKYKNPQQYGSGQKTGVMAQDLQKAGLGEAVHETPEGLLVDYDELAGPILALLTDVSHRVGKLEGR